jgi:flagellar hook-associated protein 1 FlgK
MGVDLSSIGLSGILAAEAELQAVESNISNVNNPNYSVESVNLATRPGADGGGIGVDVLGTSRAEAPFLGAEIANTQSAQTFETAFSQALQQAEGIIAPSSGNDLGQSLQALFNAFNNLSASPEDPGARSAVITAASNFAQLAQNTSANLLQGAEQTASGIPAMVAQVNSDAQQVAVLNQEINTAQANGGSAAALLDQRDGVTSDLANLIGAQTDANGNVSVVGLPLVSGTTALTLSTTGSGATTGLQIALPKANLPVQIGQIGGTIGGTLSAVSTVLSLENNVNSFATSAAQAINTVHAAGFGLDGSTGNALFLIPGGDGPIAVNPAINTQNLAAASSAAGVPGDGTNASAIAALASKIGADPSFPSATFGQAFAQLTTQFGSTLQAAQSYQAQTTASLNSLNQLKGSITGVSLNDQLTQLVQFQNALQAAGKAVQASNDIITFLVQEL